MSIKTPKRLVLAVIASLVFAPFAAIAPASAANKAVNVISAERSSTADVEVGDSVTIHITGDVTTGLVSGDTVVIYLGLTKPDGSDVALNNFDGAATAATDIYAKGAGASFTNDVTNVNSAGNRVALTVTADTVAAFTELDLGQLTFEPDVAGTYTFTIDGSTSAAVANGSPVSISVVVEEQALTASTGLGLDAADFEISNADGSAAVTTAMPGVCLVVEDEDSGKDDLVEVIYTSATADDFAVEYVTADVSTDVSTTYNLRVTVSGGTINLGAGAQNSSDAALRTMSAGQTVATYSTANALSADVDDVFPIIANGVGTVTVTIAEVKKDTNVATTIASYTFEYVTACTASVYSADDSFARLQTSSTALTAMPDPAIDVVGANKVTATGTAYLAMYLRDVYDSAISDTNSALVATATAGAVIAWGSATPTQSTAVVTSSLSTAVLYIKAGTAGTAPVTVEVKLNGTTVATKTITFTGSASTIAISSKKNSIAAGETTANAFKYAISDTGGTRIASSASVTKVDGVYVTAATAAAGSATAASGVEVTCSALKGKGSLTLTYATTKTEVVEIICAGGIDSFDIATSKSAFGPAEIGVFTITAKDSEGQAVPDGTALATAAGKLQFTGAGATFAKTPAATDTFTDGKIDFAFTTTATAGTYSLAIWHADLSPAVTKIAQFTVAGAVVAPTYTKPTLAAKLVSGRVLLFGACEADEGDMVVYVKSPGKAWQERAKTLECVAGEYEGSLKAPTTAKYYRVKQEGTGLWSNSGLIRP